MIAEKPHIDVCVCTYKRPEMLTKLLGALGQQQTGELFDYTIIVADNDRDESGRSITTEFTRRLHIPVRYCVEPQQNIALVRNRALTNARGDFVAFIDDDEFPLEQWLLILFRACVKYKVDGVLGPVKPYFEQEPPAWIRRGRFCERPEYRTGTIMQWEECRTGNLLFKKELIVGQKDVFRKEFGTGGEDKDFFMRMTESGRTFIWCNEAIVFESVPPSRCKTKYFIKRALLRGTNIVKHPTGRLPNLARSAVAIPAYVLALPFMLVAGQHHFIKYLIKLCDHVGRFLALVDLNPVRHREM